MAEKYLETNVADRRRTHRRRLHAPASVTIRTAVDGVDLSFEAALLNLSEEGMACRLDTDATEQLVKGQIVNVSYMLPTTSQSFACLARVVNITPSGDSARSIVGMEFQFTEGQEADRERLRVALERVLDGPEDSSEP